MGLVAKQTFYNLLSIGLAFTLGAINTLYMYPNHMGSRFQGVVIALLAYSNLIQPFISFGLQHAIIKFYSSFKTQKEKDSLLIFSIWSPIIIITLISLFLFLFSSNIVDDISSNEPLLSTYAFVIFLVAISTSYFEIFFSWLRVHLTSIFGNFLKEFYPRFLTFVLLTLYALNILNFEFFIYYLIAGYYIRLLIIIIYSLKIHTPRFSFTMPPVLTKIIFDEPTTGLHFHDVKKLLKSFEILIGNGHSIIVVEHNLDLIKCADHMIELGPGAGENGGKIIGQGQPEKIAKNKKAATSIFLKKKLGL
tara:strand:+ start:557 stop:1474 length:918 start_codon:yes stop_codon:yes gene_type:complete